jgi:BMFP domain-containing protein YqiC
MPGAARGRVMRDSAPLYLRGTTPVKLTRQNSALMASVSKEKPDRLGGKGGASARSATSVSLQCEALERRRQELEARNAARGAEKPTGGGDEAASPPSPHSLLRENGAVVASANTEKPGSARRCIASKASEPKTDPKMSTSDLSASPELSPPSKLTRQNSALKASLSKEKPNRVGKESISARTTSSVPSQRQALEERRGELEARKAARGSGGDETAMAASPSSPRFISRDNSALMAAATKEKPAGRVFGERSAPSPSRDTTPVMLGAPQAEATQKPPPPSDLTRQSSAVKASASKDKPERIDKGASSVRTTFSVSSQREALEKRRQELEARRRALSNQGSDRGTH